MTDEISYRFGGIARLYGEKALEYFLKSHVVVVGLGGVGSWAVEALARTGVGRLTLVDFDDICLSNTNRQIHATQNSVGVMKTAALKKRIQSIHPSCLVECLDEPYDSTMNSRFFSSEPDVIIDAVDQFSAKLSLILASQEFQVPLVLSGAAGGRRDPSAIQYGDLSESREDPILSRLRKHLRQKHQFPRQGKMGVSCVYSLEKPYYPSIDGKVSRQRQETFKKPLDCATGFGTVSWVTGSFGFLCAHLATQHLVSKADLSSLKSI